MGMHALAVLLSAAVAAVAPAAAGKRPPLTPAALAPVPIRIVRIAPSSAAHSRRSCTANGPRSKSNRAERNLAPVACEQPPRSHLNLPGLAIPAALAGLTGG